MEMVRILRYTSGGAGAEESPREITKTPSSSGESGWLIRFFDSGFFCEWIAVSYLYKHEHSGVRDYLCNRMYSLPLSGIENYLFQLCYMMIIKPCPSLDKYVVDMCTKSLKIAVKVHWFLIAESEDSDDNEEILRLQEKCQMAALAGDWPPLIKPQKSGSSPSGKSRMFKLLSSSSRKILPLTSSPTNQKPVAATTAPEDGSKISQEDTESSYKVLKKLMPGAKVRDMVKKFREKEEEEVDQSKEVEQESFFRRIFRDKDEEERTVRSDELANSESFFRRIFRDKTESDDRPGSRVTDDDDEVKGLFFLFRKIFREKHDDREKGEDEEKINGSWDDDSDFFLFRKFFRVHPEEDEKLAPSIFDSANFGTPENSPGADGFFKRLFRDRSLEDSKQTPSRKEDRNSPGLFKRLFKDRGEEGAEDSVSSTDTGESESVRAGRLRSRSGREDTSSEHVFEKFHLERVPSARLDFEENEQKPSNSAPANRAASENGVAPEKSVSEKTSTSAFSSAHRLFTSGDWSLMPGGKTKRPGSPKQRTERSSSKPPLPRYSSFHIRKGTYHATLDFVRSLCEIASGLVDVFPVEDRRKALHESLMELNNHLSRAEQDGGVCFPMGKGLYRVVHIPENDATLMNSREKAPFLVCFEVLKCETECSQKESKESSRVHRGGIPLANGDAQLQRPPPWAYPVWSNADSQRTASQAIDRAMAHDWATSVKVVELTLTVSQAESESVNPEQGQESWVHVNLRSVADINLEEVEENFPAKKKDHRRVPSTVAMDAVRAAAAKGEAPPGLPVKRSGIETDQVGINSSKPSDALAGELWENKKERIRKSSPFGAMSGWDLRSAIVKSGDDCRQEHLAVQLVSHFYDIFQEAGVALWLRPYEVLVTSSRAALIETISDTASIHAIKSRYSSLRDYFCKKYDENSPEFKLAQRNFVESMAGYSILCYLLQVKDRHNANLLIDEDGHIIHIDFGFMLSNSPGGVNFENVPFKLTREQLEVMDSDAEGTASEFFDYFKVLCIQGFLTCRKHAERIILLVEMMQDSGCPCFRGGPKTIINLRKRFHPNLTEEHCVSLVLSLISSSLDAWRTRQYDYYQRVLNGIQ